MNDDLPLGTHLVTPRGWYLHHGIYVGNGRVVHYSGFCKGIHAGPIEEVSLGEFTRGRGLRVQSTIDSPFAPTEVAARARSRVGEDSYRLLANNCEHFCEWCVTGRSRSQQVELFLSLPTRLFCRVLSKRLYRRIADALRPPFGDRVLPS